MRPWSSVPFPLQLRPLLLFLGTQAAVEAGSEPGDPNQNAAGSPASDLCEAGHYVSADCTLGRAVRCCPCPPDSFLAHPNRAPSCSPCTQCREDQEMVSDCTPKQDRKCQCKTGEFYCDSEHCLEGCHPCTRCPEGKVVLQTCNATADTLCGRPGPGPGSRHRFWWMAGWLFAAVAGALVILCARKPGDGGGWATCCCPHAGPVSTGHPYRRDSLESSVPFVSSPETPDADAPVPTTGALHLPEDRLDVASEPPILPGTPESPAGDGPRPEAEAEPPLRHCFLEEKMSRCKTGNCLTIRNSSLAEVLRARALLGPQDAMSVPIICDFGSGSSKVGFAGAKMPLAVFPTVLGKFRHLKDDLMVGLDKKVWFIGEEIQEQREKLNLVYPLSRATVTNWDHMEKIWHHSFYQVLRAAPEQHPLLLTEPPSNPKASKERTAQILFETFNVPALYLVNQGVLSLFSSGLTSGTIIESGDGMTHFVPIIEGYPLHQSTMQMELAGQDITLYLMQLLSKKGNSLLGTGDREYIRDLKEKCCYVALNFDKEKAAAPFLTRAWTHQLPDGREIDLGQEMFLCMEVLFQPDLIGRNSLGAHMIAFRSVSSCSPNQQRPLFESVVLSGGTGSSPSLRARMQRELSALVSPKTKVKVSTCPCSVYSAWMGGSVLCSLSTFKDMWVSSDDYKEEGPSAVSRKSF